MSMIPKPDNEYTKEKPTGSSPFGYNVKLKCNINK